MNVRNRFWDVRRNVVYTDGKGRMRGLFYEARPPDTNCPWCAQAPDRPWGTFGTSHRNIKRAIRKGRLRVVPNYHRTLAVCNHPCHEGKP